MCYRHLRLMVRVKVVLTISLHNPFGMTWQSHPIQIIGQGTRPIGSRNHYPTHVSYSTDSLKEKHSFWGPEVNTIIQTITFLCFD